ncbi:MAG TPA: hypothetical protein VF970_13890 [Gemmatimonadales bacterium]
MPSLRYEADPFARRRARLHEFPDGLEHNPELGIMAFLEGVQLLGQIGVGLEHLSEPHKRAHDLDVDADGARAAENAREHRHALLSEGVGRVFAVRATAGF